MIKIACTIFIIFNGNALYFKSYFYVSETLIKADFKIFKY